ncbi:hypothetical protein CPB86DRAFT_738569 [Serendipita vermifera]|nr:hypothetical protein CPB86DRAFT_738569 [Serendipita vermifera]
MVFLLLDEDEHSLNLRAALEPLNGHMYLLNELMEFCIEKFEVYYTHSFTKFCQKGLPNTITDEQVAVLLDSAFQREIRQQLEEAIELIDISINILNEEVVPRLPQIERELAAFVEDYTKRYRMYEQRSRSWSFGRVKDILFGPSTFPCEWKVDEVQGFPGILAPARASVERLGPFLERLRLHLLRLSQLKPSELPGLGYSNMEDFRRLYMDRLKGKGIFYSMTGQWYLIGKGLWDGIPYYRKFLRTDSVRLLLVPSYLRKADGDTLSR